jgi:hypothetical protein
MATEKQIAANRANAKRSTGPRSLAGKLVSSRNAYRHGLSVPLPLDAELLEKVDTVATALVGNGANEEQLNTASEFVQAQLELLRIRTTRTGLMETFEPGFNNIEELRRIAALDRYERYCLTKRRRASRGFDAGKAKE